jgi:hypothetical protein
MKTSICWGYKALHDWECLLLRDGYINEYCKDFSEKDIVKDLERIKNYKIMNKQFLYFSMILFDKIDSSYLSMYNLDRIIDLGVIEEHGNITESKLEFLPKSPFDTLSKSTYIENETMYNINHISTEIMELSKESVIRTIYNKFKKHGWYFEEDRIRKNYGTWIKDCEMWGSSIDWEQSKETLGIVKESLMRGIYNSIKNNSIYYDGGLSDSAKLQMSSIGQNRFSEDISYIVNLDLSSELYHLPVPTNMEEVIKLRNRNEIQQFRREFFSWCSFLRNGEIDLANKIKKDVDLAKKELEKYYKWENNKTKVFNCLIDVVGGQIPYISNLNGVFSPFSTRNMLNRRKENSWILLLK